MRPRETLGETVRKDLDLNGVSEDMVYDRSKWYCLFLWLAPPSGKGFCCCIRFAG